MNGHWLFTQKPNGKFTYQCSLCGAFCSGAYRMCPRCRSVNLDVVATSTNISECDTTTGVEQR